MSTTKNNRKDSRSLKSSILVEITESKSLYITLRSSSKHTEGLSSSIPHLQKSESITHGEKEGLQPIAASEKTLSNTEKLFAEMQKDFHYKKGRIEEKSRCPFKEYKKIGFSVVEIIMIISKF